MKTKILDVSTHPGRDERPGFTVYTVRPDGVLCELKHDGPAIYGWQKGATIELPPAEELKPGAASRGGAKIFYIPNVLADELDAAARAAADSHDFASPTPSGVLTEARLAQLEGRIEEILILLTALRPPAPDPRRGAGGEIPF